MRRFEFKTVRFRHGFGKRLLGDNYDESFEAMLAQHGQDGWDLKTAIQEPLRTVLIFSREVQHEAKN